MPSSQSKNSGSRGSNRSSRSRSRSSSRSKSRSGGSRSTSRTRSPSEKSRSRSGSRSSTPERAKENQVPSAAVPASVPASLVSNSGNKTSKPADSATYERKDKHASSAATDEGVSKPTENADVNLDANDTDSVIQQLKRANEDLRKQLMQLNSKLDSELARRENKARRKYRASPFGIITEAQYQKLKQEVEELRRDHTLAKVQVYQGDGTSRIADLRNQIAEKDKEIEKLREANRGLERVKKSQARKMEAVNHIETEITRIRTNHIEELRILRDRMRRVKEVKEQDERSLKHIQAQINQLQDKAAIMKGFRQSGETRLLSELEQEVQEKEKLHKELQDEAESLQKKLELEKRRTVSSKSVTATDVENLRKAVTKLKEELASREAVLAREEKAVKKLARKVEEK